MGKALTKEKQSDQPPPPQTELEHDVDSISQLLAHPLFLRSQDSLLSTITEPIRLTLQPTQNKVGLGVYYTEFKDYLAKVLPQADTNREVRDDLFKKVNESNKTICWKVIPMNDIFFRCLDCEASDTISVICKECFEKGNHKGHRAFRCRPAGSGYTCDCGILDTIRLEGTCPDHLPKEQTIEEALADFPQDIRQKFSEAFKKAIYGIICVLEIREKARSKKLKDEIDSLLQRYLSCLVDFYFFVSEEFSKSFSLVIERILRASLEAPNNLVWHDCNDLKNESLAKNSGINPPKECSCTVLGCLLRFSKHFDNEIQARFKSLLIESCKEKESKKFLDREICRYIYFLLGDPLNGNAEVKKHTSGLYEAVRNELSLDEEDFHYTDNIVGALRRLLGDCSEIDQENMLAVFGITAPLAKYLTDGSKASEKSIHQTKLMTEFLAIILDFQVKSLYPGEIRLGLFEHNVDYGALNTKLLVERRICVNLDHSLKMLGDLPLDRKEPTFKRIAKDWHNYFQTAKMIQDHQRLFQRQINPLSGLEKTLCLVIIHYLQDNITKESLEGFFKLIFPDIYPSSLASSAVRGPLITVGVMRFTEIIKAASTGPNSFYFTFDNIYDIDIVSIQLMTLLINPQDLFSLFTNSFFSYAQDLTDFCLSPEAFTIESLRDHPNSRQMILLLEDFLEFFIYLMNDEISLMNLNLRPKLSRKRPDFPPERIIKKVFVNILAEMKWFSVEPIKKIAKVFIENLPTSVDSVLSKIIIKNDQYKIKLKEEYESELDPYMFYKSYHDQKMRQNDLTSQEMKTQDRDIVSGKFYTDLPPYLIDIQQNIFQSQLPEFVRYILMNFTKEISRLLQPALKLVLFNLQVVNEALENPNFSAQNLQKKVEANYLNKAFSQSLHKILNEGDYKDCEKCIHNIQSLIKQLSSQVMMRQQSVGPVEESKEDIMAEKKRQAKEKMEKLKEEFAKKQAAFAQKNEDLLVHKEAESPEQVVESSPDRKDLVCQYCLDKIDEFSGDEYGVPLYIEFTNNFYNTEEEVVFKEGDYTDLSKARWWPVISSCNHSYHRSCFDKHCQSSRGPQNEASQLFMNELESQCALCKKLNNSFLVMNTDLVSKDTEKSAERYMLVIQELLTLRIDSLKGTGDATIQEIVRRGYEYFMESFHLYKKPNSLKENFELYLNFFKTLKNCPFIKSEAVSEKKSFLKSIFSRNSNASAEKVYPESVANDMVFNLLLEKLSLSNPEEGFAVDEHLKIIKEYLIYNIVYFVRSEKSEGTTHLVDVVSLYKENQEFRNQVINEISLPMQKVLLALYLNKCVLSASESPEKSEFCRILCTLEEKNPSEKLDSLLKIAQVPFSVDQLCEESLLSIETLSESDKKLLSSIINPESPILKTGRLRLAPQFYSQALPQTYQDFSQKFISQKCDLCNEYNSNFLVSTCLICGKCLCPVGCNQSQFRPGNLSKHANNCHMGLGLFFIFGPQALIALKGPLSLIYSSGHMYANELGESMGDMLANVNFDGCQLPKTLDFEKFVLNEKGLEKITKVIMQHSMGQELFENASHRINEFFNDTRL